MNENYLAVAQALNLTREQIIHLAKNSFIASFLNDITKQKMIDAIDLYYQEQKN
jgi:adenosine deaminase